MASLLSSPSFVELLRTAIDEQGEFVDRRLARREVLTKLDASAVLSLLGSDGSGSAILRAAEAVSGDDEEGEGRFISALGLIVEGICEVAQQGAVAGIGLESILRALAPLVGHHPTGTAASRLVVDVVRAVRFEGSPHPLVCALAECSVDALFQLIDADTSEAVIVSALGSSPLMANATRSLETALCQAVAGEECDILLLAANLHVIGPLGQQQPLPSSLIALMVRAVSIAAGRESTPSEEILVVLPTVIKSLSQLLRNPVNASACNEKEFDTLVMHGLGESTHLTAEARELLLDVVSSMAAHEALCGVAGAAIEQCLPSILGGRGSTFGEVASALMVVASFVGATHRRAPGGNAEIRGSNGEPLLSLRYFNTYLWPKRTHHEPSVRRALWHAVDALIQNPVTRPVALGSAASFLAGYSVQVPRGEERDVRAAQMSCMATLLRCQEAAAFHAKITAEKSKGLYPKGNEGAMQLAEENYQR